MLTAADFDQLGFWEDATPEENITVYGMDFCTDYIMLTDDLGKTPLDAKNLSLLPPMMMLTAFVGCRAEKLCGTQGAVCSICTRKCRAFSSAEGL